ncbi:MAG: hypothetical protein GX811_13750 [Lentisphaerae bacterium]|nr:hypothetical protein [Lentisphaerota bacterium]
MAVKKDEAMGDAKKNCRLMILDFRLEPSPPTTDGLARSGNECRYIYPQIDAD